MKINEYNKNKWFVSFDYIQEFKKYLDNTKPNKIFYDKRFQCSLDNDFSFRGTYSFEEAQKLMENGWEEGAKNITGKFNNAILKHKKIQNVKKNIYDIQGYQACVPRYLQDIPTSMINKKNYKKQVKILNVYKSICYNHKWEKDDIIKESVKALLIVDKLESAGYRCNLYTIFGSKKNNEEVICVVKIKDSKEKINIFKCAYLLAHPSFLRRHMFRFIELFPHITGRNFIWSYGVPILKNDLKNILKKQQQQNDFLFIDLSICKSFEEILNINDFKEIEEIL